jgi:hypothetical protein
MIETTADTPTVATPKPPTYRSPSYPAYDLQVALERAVKLNELAGAHDVNVSTAVIHWGYTVKSSKGAQVLAATKKFGLTDDKGKGDARVIGLTPLGRELVYYTASNQGSEAWLERAQIAALAPTLHRELWDRYSGQLPTDGVLKDYLVLTRHFNAESADEAIGVFRRSLAFAGVTAVTGATIAEPPNGEPREEGTEPMTPVAAPTVQPSPPAASSVPVSASPPTPSNSATPVAPTDPAPVTVNILLPENGWASISTSGRLSEAQWSQFMDVLKAMKPGFLRP